MSTIWSKEAAGGERFCRICADAEQADNRLISPCECKGTIRFVHRTCLKQSIEISRRLNCTICRSNLKGIRIGVRLPGRLRFVRCNLLKVAYHVFLLLVLVANDAFILHRGVEFYLKRINQIERRLVQIEAEQRGQAEFVREPSHIDQAIEPVSSSPKMPKNSKEPASGILFDLRRSIGRLFRIVLLGYLKAIKMLLQTDQSKLLFMVSSIFVTALYLANDLVQFAFVFVFIWYVYRCLRDAFVIWSAKNAELVVDFTSDPLFG